MSRSGLCIETAGLRQSGAALLELECAGLRSMRSQAVDGGIKALRRFSRRIFRERQILVRSKDRVRCLTLGPRAQKAAAAALLIGCVWVTISGVGLWLQQERLDERSRELAQSRAEYHGLLTRIEDVGAQADRLAARLEAGGEGAGDLLAIEAGGFPLALERLRGDLTSLAHENLRLTEEVLTARKEWREAERRLAALGEERERLNAQLADTMAALHDAGQRREEVHAQLDDVKADLRAARLARQAEANGRLSAQSRAEELEKVLAAARLNESSLNAEREALEARLTESRAGEAALLLERQELAQRLAHLEDSVGQSGGVVAQGDLGERIARLRELLLAAERRSDLLISERKRQQTQIDQLRAHIDSVEEQHSGVFEHFAERTREGVQRMERTLHLTGLDLDVLVERIIDDSQARGGPYIPASTGDDASLGDGVRVLDHEMQRLAALQIALASLPITAPLDAYWISSTFGRRRDPVNNRLAQHQGLDLAAEKGSPVYASAPGTVTLAGWKGAYGRMVEIDHGFGVRSRYAHMRSIAVEKGQTVGHREVVGELGTSGRSTGPHVHFEVLWDGEPIDPMNFLKAGQYVFKE